MLQQLSSLLMQLISQATANGQTATATPAVAASSSTPPMAATMPPPGTVAGSVQPPSGVHGVGCSGGAPPQHWQSSHNATSSTSYENVVVMSKIKRDLFKHQDVEKWSLQVSFHLWKGTFITTAMSVDVWCTAVECVCGK